MYTNTCVSVTASSSPKGSDLMTTRFNKTPQIYYGGSVTPADMTWTLPFRN